jgi:hypothetical protein
MILYCTVLYLLLVAVMANSKSLANHFVHAEDFFTLFNLDS